MGWCISCGAFEYEKPHWSNYVHGKGYPISTPTQNTRSSTEDETVGVNDGVYLVLWVRHFLEKQVCNIENNILYQNNQSTTKLENNGKRTSKKIHNIWKSDISLSLIINEEINFQWNSVQLLTSLVIISQKHNKDKK